MNLTVAMCTHNPDGPLLRRAVGAVVGQLEDVQDAEVVVIDNNSAPSITARGDLDGYPVRVVEEPRQGLTAAREAAIRQARGDVILFVDDDNIVGPTYLKTTIRTFEKDDRLGLLGGSVVAEYEEPPPGWFLEFAPQLAIRPYPKDALVETTDLPYTDHFPVGAGFSVRRSLALAYLDDCNETQRIEGRRGAILSSGEDLDLGLFALYADYKLVVTGSLHLTHVIPVGRISSDYVTRLMAGTVLSSIELEAKWSKRFGRPVFPYLAESDLKVLIKAVATGAMSHWSTRYKVKYGVRKALLRIRLSERLGSKSRHPVSAT